MPLFCVSTRGSVLAGGGLLMLIVSLRNLAYYGEGSGLPSAANDMRSMQFTSRLRF